jgi:hypothetical protein
VEKKARVAATGVGNHLERVDAEFVVWCVGRQENSIWRSLQVNDSLDILGYWSRGKAKPVIII